MILLNIIFSLLLTSAQEKPYFIKQKLTFSSGSKLIVEIAESQQERSYGLMNRKNMPQGTGMLFIFPHEQELAFWMKNTLIPLSIGYFDKSKKLLEIKDMSPLQGPVMDENIPLHASTKPAKYALEVPQGWYQKNKIKPGTTFKLEPLQNPPKKSNSHLKLKNTNTSTNNKN